MSWDGFHPSSPFTPFAPVCVLGHLPRQGGGLVLQLPLGVGGWRGAPWLPLDGGAVSRRLTEGGGKHIPQIRRNPPLCGTFGYIYWNLGRSASVGGRAAIWAIPVPWQSPGPAGHPLSKGGGKGALAKIAQVCRPYGGSVTRGTACGRVRTPAPTGTTYHRWP